MDPPRNYTTETPINSCRGLRFEVNHHPTCALNKSLMDEEREKRKKVTMMMMIAETWDFTIMAGYFPTTTQEMYNSSRKNFDRMVVVPYRLHDGVSSMVDSLGIYIINSGNWPRPTHDCRALTSRAPCNYIEKFPNVIYIDVFRN